MRFWRLSGLLLALLSLKGQLDAQWRGPQLTYLGAGEGISASITDIAQDSSGILYLASNIGMYTYDSHVFRFYGHDPMDPTSISQGNVQSIICSRDGIIWLTTRFGGLNSFDPETGKFVCYPVPSLEYHSDPGAFALLEDSDSTILVSAGHFRLLAFNRRTNAFTSYSPDWINAREHGGRLMPLSIVQDRSDPNLLWLSILDYRSPGALYDSYSLVTFDKMKKQFTSFPCFGKTRYIDSKGRLYGNFWGNFITRFDPHTMLCDTFQFELLYRGKMIKPLTHDIELYHDRLYVTSSKSLMTFDEEEGFQTVFQASEEDEFACLFTDNMDNLWIGSNHAVHVMEPNRQHIRFFSLSKFGFVNRLFPGRLAYYAPDDVVYLSQTQNAEYYGFFRIPLSENQNEEATFIPTSFPVTGIVTDHRNKIWVLGDGKFQLLDPTTHRLVQAGVSEENNEPLPWAFVMRSNPSGWIGALDGGQFIWFHADTMKLNRVRLRDLPGSAFAKSFGNNFHGFTFTKSNAALLYSNEVHRVDLENGETTVLKYDTLANLHQQSIRYVGEDQQGFIWMSTFTMVGKFKLQGDSLILERHYTLKDGMVSPISEELQPDLNNRIWCFTGIGLNCIDPSSHEIRYFGYREGLPLPYLDPTEVLSLSDGRLVTVCDNGLIVFDTEALWNSAGPSDVRTVFKNIRVDGNALTPDQMQKALSGVMLNAENRGLDIEFQALAYPMDYRVEYSYRIVGMQSDWISIGQNRLITIPALAPGAYTFEVKAGRPQSRAPTRALQIYVKTPLIRQLWFLGLCAFLISLVLFGLYRWRIRRIRAHEEEKTSIAKQIAELELKALRSQMNPHFMFNSLNSIKNYILHAEPQLAAEYLSNFAHLIRLILQNSREKSISLQEELETLILYIELEQLRFDEEFDFRYIVDADVRLENIKIPPMLLQPYVENAIWHGLMHKKGRGHLLLHFSRQGEMVACIIDDDGVGRESAKQMKSLSATRYKSMGMGITQDRIEIMNKMDALGISTEIIDKKDESGNPSGTRVVIRIPASGELYT